MKLGAAVRSTLIGAIFALFTVNSAAIRSAAAESDCDLCKKDHKKICADECEGQEKSEGCKRECVQSKCVSSCADEKKDKKPKDGKKEQKKNEKSDKPKTPKEGKKNSDKPKNKGK